MVDISTRETTSKKIPEINSIYVYKTSQKGVKFNRHLNKGSGYRYTIKNAILKGGEDEIFDYHRTAKIKDVEQGLVLVTKNSNFKDVQKFFKEQIAEIEKDDKLFAKFKSAKSSPQEIGLYFHY